MNLFECIRLALDSIKANKLRFISKILLWKWGYYLMFK